MPKAWDNSAGKFYYICDHYRHSLDPKAYEAEQTELVENRKLTITTCDDGMVLIKGVFDPEGGAALRTAWEPLARRSGAHDDRSREKRLADAAVEVAVHALDIGAIPQQATQRTHLQVTVPIETMLRLPGTPAADMEFSPVPVSARTVERLACDASVTRIVFDSESQVIDVGRAKRTVSGPARKALNIRDRGCSWPGCDRPASWTSAHHIRHWLHGGVNDPDNLTLLCYRHHWNVHEGGWQIVRGDDGRMLTIPPMVTFLAPARGPDQEPVICEPVDVPLTSAQVKVDDRRLVGFATWGDSDPSAPAVVHCHGTPGGRLVPYSTAARSGLRHVSLDRPGFGLSDPQPGRTVSDHVADVEAVLDHLGIDGCAVFGWSGGGPHALALGALLPNRVARVAVLGSMAPDDDPSFDITAGMPEINSESRRMLKENPEDDRRDAEAAVRAFLEDPESFLAQVDSILDPVDVTAGREMNVRAQMIVQLRDAFQNGAEGWFEDDMVSVLPWGFALEDVRADVWLWHGERDRLVPISHGRHMAGRLPRCTALFLPDDGHVSPLGRLPEILDWLVSPTTA